MSLKYDWEFNVLGIYNFNRRGKLDAYYDWIRSNHRKVVGDILEAGVFRGRSLLATALLLKELGSDKRVYGFDSFSGFPPIYHDKDQIAEFARLRAAGAISEEHLRAHERLTKYRNFLKNAPISVRNISSSEEFSNTDRAAIERKAGFLGLDNIVLVEGDFAQTMSAQSAGGTDQQRFSCCLLDCDLYLSYQQALSYLWPRLTDGGFVFLDEYFSLKFPGARMACDEFFNALPQKPKRLDSGSDDFFERWGVEK